MSESSTLQEWFPVIWHSESGCVFGLSGEDWAVETPNGDVILVSLRPAALLPLLKTPFQEFEAITTRAYETAAMPQEGRVPLPVEQIIGTAVKSQSAYWQGLAIDRLAEMADARAFEHHLSALAKEGVEQTTRHRARALSKRSRHNNGAL